MVTFLSRIFEVNIVYFVVSIFDLVHDVESIHGIS